MRIAYYYYIAENEITEEHEKFLVETLKADLLFLTPADNILEHTQYPYFDIRDF